MPTCTRNGCRKKYDDQSNDHCAYHSGNPVFHEGLKSWSCCNEINKPVLTFDDFVAIPGCSTADGHTDEQPKSSAPVATSAHAEAIPLKLSKQADGSEVYGTPQKKVDLPTAVAQAASANTVTIEEDDLSIPVPQGTKCQRKGCEYTFVDEETSRTGTQSSADCLFHPAPPLFREGSKGYLCCKRRVLEFDEFLKIPGCTKGRHLFIPKVKSERTTETNITCRLDHYQTPQNVHVSVFAKQSDRERSLVVIEENQLKLDIFMPEMKRFQKIVELYGPVDVKNSSFQFLNSKIEIKLAKLDGRSWNMLEKTVNPNGSLNLTFGVGGRIGTVGAKEMVLGTENRPSSKGCGD